MLFFSRSMRRVNSCYPARMRVVTWNMAYWSHRATHDEAWRWILTELRPDVLLCQEAVVPDWVAADHSVIWSRAYDAGRQPWGTGIVSRLRCSPCRIPGLDTWFEALPATIEGRAEKAGIHRADGWLASARIEAPALGTELLVASVHSPAFPIEKARLAGIDYAAMKLKKNPDLWFLDVLFFFLKAQLGEKLVVGGDFNYSRHLDVTLGKERGNNEFFDRVATEGFVSLHRLFHDADEQTFFKPGRAAHQLDYLYTDAALRVHARSCCVHPVTAFSDHAPLVADLA